VEVVLVDVATAVVVNSTVVGGAVVVTEDDEPEPQAAIRRLVPAIKVVR
jgi:hypothetical protein